MTLPTRLETRPDRQWLPVAPPSAGRSRALPATPPGAPALALSVDHIDSAYTGSVGMDITGLIPGESVRFERFQVNTTDGSVDADAILQQSLLLTDGDAAMIGGVPDVNRIADLTPVDGTVTAQVDFFSGFVSQMVGEYVFRVSSPSSRFAPLTARFTVTSHAHGQSITGRVLEGATPLAHAYVALLDVADPGVNFVTGAVADADGRYSVSAPVGRYQVVAVRPGHGMRLTSGTVVPLASGATVTHDASVVAGNRHIRGKLSDRDHPGTGLPGVQLVLIGNFGDGEASELSFIHTAADGSFDATVSSGRWTLQILDRAVAQIGYLGLLDGVEVDAVDADVDDVEVLLPKAEAIFHGHLTGGGGAPLAGVEMLGFTPDFDFAAIGTTDATGFYAVATSAEPWRLEPSASDLARLGHVGLRSVDVDMVAGTAVPEDFHADPATANLDVHVRDPLGNPVSGTLVRIYGAGGDATAVGDVTDAAGDLRFALRAGTFMVEVNPFELSESIEARVPQTTLADGDTVAVTIHLVAPTRTVDVRVVDESGSPVAFLPLYLGAVIGGVEHRAFGFTEWDGTAAIPALPGDWTLLLNESGFFAPQSHGFLPTTDRLIAVGASDVTYELGLVSALVARDDSLRVARGASVTLPYAKLLANDAAGPGGTKELLYVDEESWEGVAIEAGLVSLTYTAPASGDTDSFDYLVADADGNFAFATVHVVLVDPAAPTLNVVGTVLDGADVVTRFAGVPGKTYQVQVATRLDVPDWADAGPRTADAAGRFEHRDVAPPGGARFYRALSTGGAF